MSISGRRAFVKGMPFFSTWIVLGAYSDTWAHHHLRLTSIVTPFHAVVFSGLLCGDLFLAWALWRRGATLTTWREAIPRGYGLAVAGFVLATLGAPLDLAWHYFLGIDQGFGSVTSPTHLLIAVGFTLAVSGPLRSAWSGRGRQIGWAGVLSGTLAMSMLLFVDEATHPLLAPWASDVYPRMMLPESAEQIGTIEIVVWAVITSACVLPLVLRFDLPFGALTLLLGLSGAMLTAIIGPQPLVMVGVIAGLVADELRRALRPGRDHAVRLRVFAFVVPAVMTACYFFTLRLAGGMWWPATVWTGCIIFSGVAGLLVSLLVMNGPAQCTPEGSSAILP